MQVLAVLRMIVSECVKVLTFGAEIQKLARQEIVLKLQEICDKCETAYSKVRTRLKPIKAALTQPKQLSIELRDLAADADTREAFKPDHICGAIDQLLNDLRNNLNPKRYAVDYQRLSLILTQLQQVGVYDDNIRNQYHEFTCALDSLSYQLESVSLAECNKLAEYARNVIEDFEDELSATINTVRKAKTAIVTY